MSRYSRRKFLKVCGAARRASSSRARRRRSPLRRLHRRRVRPPSQAKGLTGTITVSYPDELGVKPKYVDQGPRRRSRPRTTARQ